MPLLFVIMAALVVYALATAEGAKAFHFMFDMDFSKLDAAVVIDAVGLGFSRSAWGSAR